MRFPTPHENRERMRMRRHREVALVVAAFAIKRMRPEGLSRRERSALIDGMERHARHLLAKEGWREYA